MSIDACIFGQATKKGITRAKIDQAIADFDETLASLASADDIASLLKAKADTIAALEGRLKKITYQKYLQLKTAQALNTRISADDRGTHVAANDVLSQDTMNRTNQPHVDGAIGFYRRTAYAMMDAMLEQLRTKTVGFRQDKTGARNIVHELYGTGSTGSTAASENAKAFARASEYLHKTFNKLGGQLAKSKSWRLPNPSHSANRMWKAAKTFKAEAKAAGLKGAKAEKFMRTRTRETWKNDIRGALDREEMLHPVTSRPLTDDDFDETLDAVFDTIWSDGLAKIKPGTVGGAKLANSRDHHRVLVFKDADGWLKYNDQYGDGDVFNTLVTHIDSMSRDLGLMKVMGPNPEQTAKMLEGRIAVDAAGEGAEAIKSVFGRQKRFRDHFDTITGSANKVGSAFWGDVSGDIRNFLVTTKLPSAFLSAISDTFLHGTARHMNGFSHTAGLADVVKLMSATSKTDAQFAVRMGLDAESWTQSAFAAQKLMGEVVGSNWSQRMADTALRVSLLSPWTQANRWSMGMSAIRTYTAHRGTAFAKLPGNVREGLKRGGITASDWAKLKDAPTIEHKGAEHLDMREFAVADEDTALKFMQHIADETEFATPAGNPRVRSWLTQGTFRGTPVGEIMRSTAMFKTFPMLMMQMHVGRTIAQASTKGKFAYAAAIVAGMTVFGAVALQAKNISRGKDPYNMDPEDPEGRAFWGAAMLQGGGLGLFGDFVFADQNRFGGGLPMTMAGPAVQMVGQVQGLAQSALDSESETFGRDATNFLRYNLPYVNTWYTRLVWERKVMDELQKITDPKAARSFRRKVATSRRDFDVDYYWPPGRPEPRRAPDFERALGE